MAFDHSSNPAFSDKFFEDCAYGNDVMTVGGAVNKTFILMVIMFCSATFTWRMAMGADSLLIPTVLVGLIGGAIASFLTIFFKKISSITAPIYAILEGLTLGAISAMYEMPHQEIRDGVVVLVNGSGIVLNAIGITLGTMFAMLALYKTGVIKVTEKLRFGIVIATSGICLGYMFSLFAKILGYGGMGFASTATGIGISLVIAVVAALNFLLDFEQIEEGARKKMPTYMEWYCAFGLMLTLVWLYLEILKLLSYFSKKD